MHDKSPPPETAPDRTADKGPHEPYPEAEAWETHNEQQALKRQLEHNARLEWIAERSRKGNQR